MAFVIKVEDYREFLARHSGAVQIDGQSVSTGPLAVNGELLFVTGATCSMDDDQIRAEPPRDPLELLRARLRYWREAARRSESDFFSLKAECSRMASMAARYSNLAGPSWAMLREAKVLATMVRRANEEVSRLQAELAKLTEDDPAVQRRRILDQYEVDQQARAREVMAEVASINL